MIAPHASRSMQRAEGGSGHSPDLPFRVELWDKHKAKVERVLARTHSASLAEAVFNAACEQYPGRHLSLWRNRERLAERG